MKLNIVLTIYILQLPIFAFSQKTSIRNLSVGDEVPDIVISKIINSKKTSENINSYKDKLLIIDFWGTSCTSCVETMPKLDSLQKQFSPALAILLVADENKEKVQAFWNTNKYTKKLHLASVVEDKILNSYFRHIYFGLQAWIYKGKVIGLTSPDYVDEYNIKRVLRGDHVNWPVVNDFLKRDMNKPLFSIDSRQVDTSSVIQYSIMSGVKDSANSFAGIARNPVKKTVRAFSVNQSILSLYISSWLNVIPMGSLVKPFPDVLPNQIFWEVKDKSKYTFIKKEGDYLSEWKIRNAICFESVYRDKGQNDKEVNRDLIADLDRLMGLHVRWEKKIKKVWIVSKVNRKNTLKNIGSLGKTYPVYDFIYMLNQNPDNPYVYNESGDDAAKIPFDIKMQKDFLTIQNALNSAGYKIVEEEREVDVLIFTEVDGRPRFPKNN